MKCTHLENALALVQEELKDAREEIAALKEKLATAEATTAKVLSATAAIRENMKILDNVEGVGPVASWADRLEEYVALHK